MQSDAYDIPRITVTSRGLWLCWTAIIIIGSTVPWAGIQIHPFWNHLHLIPFTLSARQMIVDIVMNVGLYLPFGYLGVRALRIPLRPGRLLVTTFLALALSSGMEMSQLFNPYRYPTLSDVMMNVSGTVLGAYIALIEPLLSTKVLLLRAS